MTTNSPWEPCRFDANGAMVVPELHDNFVYAVAAHLEQKCLILYTEFRDAPDPELTDLRFLGCLAHHFDNVAAPSILLQLERIEPALVVEQWAGLFASRRRYSWPIAFADLPDLSRQLDDLGVVGYRVMGSCGLDGFVFASSAEHRRRTAPTEFP